MPEELSCEEIWAKQGEVYDPGIRPQEALLCDDGTGKEANLAVPGEESAPWSQSEVRSGVQARTSGIAGKSGFLHVRRPGVRSLRPVDEVTDEFMGPLLWVWV
jgi:hypothetical protein